MTDQRHKYDYQVQPNSAPARVIRMVGAHKRVLELGPGPGSITRHLHANGCGTTALELDEEAIGLVAPFCDQVHRCNLNAPNWPTLLDGMEPFSVIVAADVFEHLYDPWTTLKQTLPLLTADGCVIISLPHVAHSVVLACLLNEDFSYQPCGLLDSTHIRFWGLKNMQTLFLEAGYKIVEAEFVVRSPEQTEFAHFWHKLPSSSREALARNRFGNVYQVVLRAVPQTASGESLQLESLVVPAPGVDPNSDRSLLRRVLRRLGARLDLSTQTRIVRQLRRLGIWPKSGAGQ